MPGMWLVSAMAIGCLVVGCGDGRDAKEPRSKVTPSRNGAAASVEAGPTASQASALGLTRHPAAAYRRVCERQARDAPSAARTCPPLVPAGPLTVLYRGRSLGRASAGGGYSADFASHSLDRLRGRRIETNGGHWHYDAAWAPGVRRAVARFVERPPNATEPSSCRHRRVAHHDVTTCRVVPYRRGGGLNGGHIAYVWNSARVTYVISVHGYDNEPRARAMMAAVVTQLTASPPPSQDSNR